MSEELRGWRTDPYGVHEQRYFSLDGKPTRLVRDGGKTSHTSPLEIATSALPVIPDGKADPAPLFAMEDSTQSSRKPLYSSRGITPRVPPIVGRNPITAIPGVVHEESSSVTGGLKTHDEPRAAPILGSAWAMSGQLATDTELNPHAVRKPHSGADEGPLAISRNWRTDPFDPSPIRTCGDPERTASGNPLRRWHWERRVNYIVPWLFFASFVLWQGTTAPALTWQDSLNYESIGSLPLWSGGFWFGGRPPLTPFLWKLTGSSGAFLIAQSAISAIAWGFLAWTVGRLFPAGWRRVGTFLAILAFATTTPIEMWNRSVLSESVALSGLALLFAVAIRFAQRPSTRKAGALVAAAFWCSLARDTEIIVPLILGILFAVVAVAHRKRVTFKILIATACALFLASGFSIATVIASGRDALNTKDNLFVRVFPYPATVAWFASHGMPEKHEIDRMADATPPPKSGIAKTVFPDLTSPSFERLNTWINKHGASTYALWLLSHPWDVVLDPLRAPDRTYNDADGDLYYYAAPNKVTSGLTPVLWPPWIWLLGVMAVTMVVVNERDIRLDRAAQAVVVLGAIGIPAMLAAWNGDGQEVTRHTIEGLAQIRLGVLISFLYVALSHPRRRGVPTVDEFMVRPAPGERWEPTHRRVSHKR